MTGLEVCVCGVRSCYKNKEMVSETCSVSTICKHYFKVAVELNTYCILSLVIGIMYLNDHFGKVDSKSNICVFNINMICME